VLVNKVPYWFGSPEPGDVVVFKGPDTWAPEVAVAEPSNWFSGALLWLGRAIGVAPPSEDDFVKRVIATGGQTVKCCDPQGRVQVDGKSLDEPYIYEKKPIECRSFAPVVVTPGRRAEAALERGGCAQEGHGGCGEALRRGPGLVVLQEIEDHHLVAGMTLGRGDADGYLEAMEREAGPPGRLLAQEVIAGRAPPPWETRPEQLPLAGEVLELATGLIVHSHYLERWARELGYTRPIWRLPMPAWPEVEVDPAPLEGAPLIGSFGHLNAAKRIPQLLDAFGRLRRSHPNARLLLVGPAASGLDLQRRLERLQLGDEVVWEDYVDEPRLWSLLRACNVFVALRAPTMGETSASAIRLFRPGFRSWSATSGGSRSYRTTWRFGSPSTTTRSKRSSPRSTC